MRTPVIILAALASALAACGAEMRQPADGQPASGAGLFENTVWRQADESGAPPGAFQLFLGDGTLVTDSCWETYRLSEWRRVDDDTIIWTEDAAEIEAVIVSLTQGELVLELRLIGGAERKTYKAAAAPFVCPDMPR